jgi:hypothetical protein
MQFSQSQFLQAIGAKIPYDVAWFHRAGVVYLFARFPIKRTFLQKLIADTLYATLADTPSGTLSDTLSDTLDTLENYVHISLQRHTSEAGERQDIYEYQIDVNRLQALVDRVVLYEEMCHALAVIGNDDFVSVRLLRDKMQHTGRTVSHRRAADILVALELEGYLKTNGFRWTRGREVVRSSQLPGSYKDSQA